MEAVGGRGAQGHGARLTVPARRCRRLFRLRLTRAEAIEVDDEFRVHLTMRERELEAAGYAPDRAREAALEQFGDIDDARRFSRAKDEERMSKYRRWRFARPIAGATAPSRFR